MIEFKFAIIVIDYPCFDQFNIENNGMNSM